MSWNLLAHFAFNMVDASLVSGQAGAYDDQGRWVPAMAEAVPIRIMNPQPAGSKELELLRDGEHIRDFRVTWVDADLQIKVREGAEDSDRIILDSTTFKVMVAGDRGFLGGFKRLVLRAER